MNSMILENAKFLWLAKEIFVTGLGTRKPVRENVDWRYFYDKWGFIAGEHIDRIMGLHAKNIGPKLLEEKWALIGSIPLASAELIANISKPPKRALDMFPYEIILVEFSNNYGVDTEFVFEKNKHLPLGKNIADEILFIGHEKFRDSISMVPRLLLLVRVREHYLVHTFGGLWIDLTTGSRYSLSLRGFFWPTLDQIKDIRPLKIAGSTKYTFYSESGNIVTLEFSGKIRLLVNGEEKNEDIWVGGLAPTKLLSVLREFTKRYRDVTYGFAVYRAFMAMSEVIPPRLLRVLAFFMKYNHIDYHRSWFFPIKKLEDFDTYLRYARILRHRYGILMGRGPEWKVNKERLLELIKENVHMIIAKWLERPQLGKYLYVIMSRTEHISVNEIAKALNVTPSWVRQVFRVLSLYGFVRKTGSKWVVDKKSLDTYASRVLRLLHEGIGKPDVLEGGFIGSWVIRLIRGLFLGNGLPRYVPASDTLGIMGLDLLEGEPIVFRIMNIPLALIAKASGRKDIIDGDPDIPLRGAIHWNLFSGSIIRGYMSREDVPAEFLGLYDYLMIQRASRLGEIYIGPLNLGGKDVWRGKDLLLR